MHQRYVALVFCSIVWFMHNFIANSFAVLLPLVTKEFSLSYSDTGILATASLLVFAFMQLPTGHFAVRIGFKRILVFGIALVSAFNILLSTAASYSQFFVFHMFRAVGSGCHLTVGTALISNLFETHERGKAIGTHESAVSLAGLVSPIVTLPLAILFDWRTTYLIYGVLGLTVTAAAWMFLPGVETSAESGSPGARVERGGFDSRVLVLLLIMTIHAFVFHAISTFLPLYLSTEKGILLLYLGYYVAIPSLLGLVGRPLGGYMSDRVGRRSMTLISLVFLASGIVIVVVAREGTWLVLALALLGLGLHTVIPVLFAFLMDLFSPEKRALIAGRINAIRHTVAGFSPTIVGVVADAAGFSVAFLMLAFAVLVNFFVALKTREERSVSVS